MPTHQRTKVVDIFCKYPVQKFCTTATLYQQYTIYTICYMPFLEYLYFVKIMVHSAEFC